MEISYLGHSSFRIKTKAGIVVTDPFGSKVGWKMPTISADVVVISHDHDDHNNSTAVTGTSRRKEPFVIREPGEYEVEGISIFGYQTYHDNKDGAEKGENTIYVVQSEELRVLHLGDLGHMLSEKLIDELNGIDVLMVPVGGHFTMELETAIKVIEAIDPTFVLPMHYRTEAHDQKVFGSMTDLATFVAKYGRSAKTVKSLSLSRLSLPQDLTEVVVFEQ